MAHAGKHAVLREVAVILRKFLIPFTLLGLVFGGMAGCLTQTPEADEPEYLVSRIHTLTIDRGSVERAESMGGPDGVRELIRTDIEVRVGSVGTYALEYTTRLGVVKTDPLVALAPGLPATVGDVDPFAPVKLRKGTEVVFERAANVQDWFHVGDVPLGLTMTPGASASYASTARVTESISLSDIEVPEANVKLDSLEFTLKLPLDGTLRYELGAQGADGAPLEIEGSYSIPSGQGDLISAEIKATQEGTAGTAGVKAGVEQALAKGGITLWIKDGQPIAGRFDGGEVSVDPMVAMWADGFFGEMAEGSSCAGKTKADNCQPEEIESFQETIDPSEREDFPVEDFPRVSDDEEVQKGVDLLKTLFAVDVAQGDKVQLIATVQDEDIPDAPADFQGESRTEWILEAVGTESVTVKAGTFETIKIVQTLTTRTTTSPLRADGEVLVKALNVNETITRTTFWLDAQTYQPIKMTAEVPVDIDRLFKDILASVGDKAWREAGMDPVREDQWRITAKAEASYEAVRIDPTTRFSAVVGLMTAQALSTSGIAIPMSALGASGMPFGPSDDMHYEQPVSPRPMSHLALTSDGPLADGVKSYTVASASPAFNWGDVTVSVDGMTLFQDSLDECMPPTMPYWLACDGSLVEERYDSIDAGDTLRVPAQEGQTLRIVDAYTNSVILTMRVA